MRLRRIHTLIVLAALATGMAYPASGPRKGWEPVRSERADARSVTRTSELEIKTARGTVIVETSHQVQVRIVTILGRTISQETLPAGISQLSLPHGVYIIKIGELTCKVAV